MIILRIEVFSSTSLVLPRLSVLRLSVLRLTRFEVKRNTEIHRTKLILILNLIQPFWEFRKPFCEIHRFDALAHIISDVFSRRSLGVSDISTPYPSLHSEPLNTDRLLTCVPSVSYNSSHNTPNTLWLVFIKIYTFCQFLT